MSVLDELRAICRKHGGILRPSDVVDFAQAEDTALHDKFTWNDRKAATEYRLWQARELIQVSVDVIEGRKEPFKVFVSLKGDRSEKGGGYRMLVDVLSNSEGRKLLLAEALEELATFREKYAALQELVPVWQAMRKVRRA